MVGSLEYEEKIKDLVSKFNPSKLDNEIYAACPNYIENSRVVPAVYSQMHDMFRNYILVCLKSKLNGIFVEGEVNLEFGRINGRIRNKLLVKERDGKAILIEVKLNSTKLIQPAVYAYIANSTVLVVELYSGCVYKIDPELARSILEFASKFLEFKNDLREKGEKIPGDWCKFCAAECEYKSQFKDYNPLKSLPQILRNLDDVVDKLVAYVKQILDSEF